MAGTIERLNKLSPKILVGRISTHRECLELWRAQAADLEALIAEGALNQKVTIWLQSAKVVCDVTFDLMAMFVPAGKVVKGVVTGFGKDGIDLVIDSIRSGVTAGVKDWTAGAMKATTAGALDEASRAGPSALSKGAAEGLKNSASAASAVFTVWKGVEGIHEVVETALRYEETGVALRVRLAEVERIIRKFETEYRAQCERFDRMLEAHARMSRSA